MSVPCSSLAAALGNDTLIVNSFMSSPALARSTDGALEINGSVAAPSVTIAAPYFTNLGQVQAQGQIVVHATDVTNSGTLSASSSGAGGSVDVEFTHSYVDVASAVTRADGSSGVGGTVTVNGGGTGRLFASGTFEATGAKGGSVSLFGENVLLVAAHIDASGTAGAGGLVRVGGDFHGANPAVTNAQTTLVTSASSIQADGSGFGAGGQVVIWSQTTTTAGGSISAYSTGGGKGGTVEVSSHGQLNFSASVNAGRGGQLLLDPQNLTITTSAGGSGPTQATLTNPDSGGTWADSVTALTNGNVVVTNTTLTVSGNANAGAVYLFNGSTGALISTLTGGSANVFIGAVGIGSGRFAEVTPLTNGNFVVSSTNFGGTLGAVTFVNGTTGLTESV